MVSTILASEFQEDYAMTFQLGIVTTDGVILASDILLTNTKGIRLSYQSPKIMVYKNQGFAHCSSGDAFCDTFTENVRKQIEEKTVDFVEGEPMEVCRVLTECVNLARKEEADFVTKYNAFPGRKPTIECMGGTSMLVFRGERKVALWKVNTLRPYPSAELIVPGSCIVGGDSDNPAVFFPKIYFPRLPNNLDALISFAVHTVRMAKDAYVDGVQIGLFSLNTFRTLDEGELEPHIELSKRLDSAILKTLLEKPRGKPTRNQTIEA